MKLHGEHRLLLRHTEQALRHPGGGQGARCRRLGAGLPSGPGRAGCIQPLCSDPLACLVLCCSGCSLPREAPSSILACVQCSQSRANDTNLHSPARCKQAQSGVIRSAWMAEIILVVI